MKAALNKIHFLSYFLIIIFVIDKTDELAINIDGDLTVVGLFQIHEAKNGDCGLGTSLSSVMTSEAVKWYIEGLNKNGGLPFRIGFEGYETCRSVSKAAEIAIKVMDRALANDTIIGVIGPEFSSEAEVISPILSSVQKEKQLVQVGFSTTATRLDNSREYPNFVRVVPNDDVQIEVMILTMKNLEWNRVAVIFDNDTYGVDAYASLALRAEQEGICISLANGIPVKTGVNVTYITTLLDSIIYRSKNRSPTNGIIYIGTKSIARSIFTAIHNTGYSSVPIIMLSEGINMDTSVFKTRNGDIMPTAKGSFVFAPTYLEVTEFTQHWKSIFTNTTIFEKESETNPWLIDLYHDVIECEDRNCKFTALTEDGLISAFGAQPLYVHYSILAAHALVKAVKQLHDASKANLRSGDLQDILKNINIDPETDFKWKLDSLSSRKLQFTENIEVIQSDVQSTYEVFNFRTSNENPTIFELVKIGGYIDSGLRVNKDELRDYTIQGKERVWPNVRKAQCNVKAKCEECIRIKELQESFIYEPGDIYLIGAVAVFDTDGADNCGNIRKVSGYQTVESIWFAVNKVNQKTGDFVNFFPGLKIGLIVLNSCNNAVVIQRKIYELQKNGIKTSDGTVVEVSGKVIGYIGDIVSSTSIAVAELLSRLHIVQISFASTSPLLSDRSKYPYFMRVVTPDDAQAHAMIRIIQEVDADYIQIIHSKGAYGEGGKNKIKEIASENKICVIQEIPVTESGSQFEIFEKLRRFPHARIVIIFLQSHKVEPVMKALVSQMKYRGEFMFIGSEAWARKRDPLVNDKNQVLLGSFTLSLEIYQDNELRSHLQSITPKPIKKNPWSMIYLQEKRNCYFDLSFDKTKPERCPSANDYSINLDSWDTSAFVAVKSLLIGANAFLRDRCGLKADGLCDEFRNNPAGLVERIGQTKLDLDGTGNKINVFNDNGDGNIGFRIYNIQKDDDPQNLIFTEVGRYPLKGTFTFEKSLIVTPTGSELVSTCPNEQACSECIITDKELDETEDDKSISMGMLILGVLLALSVVAVIILLLVVFRLRRIRHADKEIYLTPVSSSAEPSNEGTDLGRQGGLIPPCSRGTSLSSQPEVVQTTTHNSFL